MPMGLVLLKTSILHVHAAGGSSCLQASINRAIAIAIKDLIISS